MKITDIKYIADSLKPGPHIIPIERVVCYKTSGGQVAILKQKSISRWGFFYASGILNPRTPIKTVFSASTAYDAMQSAYEAGRELHTFTVMTEFWSWAANGEKNIPFEKGRTYYLNEDIYSPAYKAGTPVTIVNTYTKDSPLVDVYIEGHKRKVTVNKLLLDEIPPLVTVNETKLTHDEIEILTPGEIKKVVDTIKGDDEMKVESRLYFNEENCADLTDDELYQRIARIEKEISKYDDIKNKPKKLEARAEELKAEVQKLVDYIDSRTDNG